MVRFYAIRLLQKASRCFDERRAGDGQVGLSIIEVLISLGLLGVTFAAYTKFYSNTMHVSRDMSKRVDYYMLRKYIQTQFSCEKTLAKTTQRVNGRLVNVGCQGGTIGNPVDILNSDGTVIFPTNDPNNIKDRKGAIKNGDVVGGYRVVGLCDGNGTVPDPSSPISVPSFRFFASPELDNRTFNRGPLGHPGWIDVFDGNEVECSLPDDPGLPMDLKCTAMFVTNPDGFVTGEVAGEYFRANGNPGYIKKGWSMPSLVIRSQRDLDAPAEGRIANWKMKWMNKNPEESIGTFATGRKIVDGMVQPVPSEEFTVPGNQRLTSLNQPLDQCVRPSEISQTIPVLNQNPACSYWEQKIEFNQMKNPSDWYGAPLDLLISGYDAAGAKITECATKVQMVSPLVLIWPKSAESPHELDFYPTATRFDITASGTKVNTGWINESAAFLVLDHNHNGKIDDGSELFGDASALRVPGNGTTRRYANGFAALADYDDNHDLFIDREDAVFKDLRLWFDENADGQSQPWELQELANFEVKRIGLNYKGVDKQPAEANGLTNFVYESSFYGPDVCGSEGCRIYDIYFTTVPPIGVGN